MRARILIFSVLLAVAYVSHSQPWTAPRWDDCVIVRKLDKELPAKEADVWNFLASNLINDPETDAFGTLTTRQSKEWLPRFEKSLIAKATKESLDAESLQQCLITVSNRLEKLPHLPVGAYSTKRGDVPVWIIVLKWEGDFVDAKQNHVSQPMVHTQVFAFDSRKRSVIGFATCN